jgi:hypothetical protein
VAELVAALERELPGFAVCFKTDSRLQRAIGRLLRPINRRYLTDYTTVMGGKAWFPSREAFAATHPESLYVTLCHEAVHLHDAARWPVLFQLSYLLLLPAGLTMRAFWEWRAYRESIRLWMALDGTVSDARIEALVNIFSGPEYLYMCLFRRWIRQALRNARAAHAAGPGPANDAALRRP